MRQSAGNANCVLCGESIRSDLHGAHKTPARWLAVTSRKPEGTSWSYEIDELGPYEEECFAVTVEERSEWFFWCHQCAIRQQENAISSWGKGFSVNTADRPWTARGITGAGGVVAVATVGGSQPLRFDYDTDSFHYIALWPHTTKFTKPLPCEGCGITVSLPTSWQRKRHLCSPTCTKPLKDGKHPACVHCGKLLEGKQRFYCSNRCKSAMRASKARKSRAGI